MQQCKCVLSFDSAGPGGVPFQDGCGQNVSLVIIYVVTLFLYCSFGFVVEEIVDLSGFTLFSAMYRILTMQIRHASRNILLKRVLLKCHALPKTLQRQIL